MWPKNVGILAIEIIFPAQYVDQTELETHDGVSQGKYTIGLGQMRMGFCTDREDINSLCLTVVSNLLERNRIELNTIGRIDVGTETIVDKSKSVKSVLMQLFEPYGHTDIEGLDTTNACYGGTAALFNACNWIESSSWDGRLALAVCGDIAVYASGSARPTGGAGAVAMLIGPDAPLVLDRGLRATYMKHVYDFYKPDLTSEYPLVDGKLSIQCYLSALDNCYQLYCDKYKRKKNSKNNNNNNVDEDDDGEKSTDININTFDAILFHTPFCKLVQKSLARIGLNDFLRYQENKTNNNNNNNNELNTKIINNNNNNNCCNDKNHQSSSVQQQQQQSIIYPIDFEKYNNIKLENTYFDRDIEKSFMQFYSMAFEQKTKPSLLIANQVGNMYTPSVYSGLVSLLINSGQVNESINNNNNNNNNNGDDHHLLNNDADDANDDDLNLNVNNLLGKKIGLFSYGSGLAASFYSITITTDYDKLKKLIGNILPVKKLLIQREKVSPIAFTHTMEERERGNHQAPYTPSGSIDKLFPGTFYLDSIDAMHRRTYKRTSNIQKKYYNHSQMAADTTMFNGNSSSSSSSPS